MTIDKKNNLWKWGLLIAALYFGPSILSHIRMAISGRGQQAQRQIQQQTPQQTGQTPSSVKPQPYASLDALAGNWKGQAMTGRGQCWMTLELNTIPGNDGHYSADTRLICKPTFPAMIEIIGHQPGNQWELQDALTKAMNPTSAILTGAAAANGSIHFHVDQNIAVAQVPGACDMTSLTVTPFGAARIAITYEETNVGHCHGGQIVASKAP
jgi:hypothetical protein